MWWCCGCNCALASEDFLTGETVGNAPVDWTMVGGSSWLIDAAGGAKLIVDGTAGGLMIPDQTWSQNDRQVRATLSSFSLTSTTRVVLECNDDGSQFVAMDIVLGSSGVSGDYAHKVKLISHSGVLDEAYIDQPGGGSEGSNPFMFIVHRKGANVRGQLRIGDGLPTTAPYPKFITVAASGVSVAGNRAGLGGAGGGSSGPLIKSFAMEKPSGDCETYWPHRCFTHGMQGAGGQPVAAGPPPDQPPASYFPITPAWENISGWTPYPLYKTDQPNQFVLHRTAVPFSDYHLRATFATNDWAHRRTEVFGTFRLIWEYQGAGDFMCFEVDNRPWTTWKRSIIRSVSGVETVLATDNVSRSFGSSYIIDVGVCGSAGECHTHLGTFALGGASGAGRYGFGTGDLTDTTGLPGAHLEVLAGGAAMEGCVCDFVSPFTTIPFLNGSKPTGTGGLIDEGWIDHQFLPSSTDRNVEESYWP